MFASSLFPFPSEDILLIHILRMFPFSGEQRTSFPCWQHLKLSEVTYSLSQKQQENLGLGVGFPYQAACFLGCKNLTHQEAAKSFRKCNMGSDLSPNTLHKQLQTL